MDYKNIPISESVSIPVPVGLTPDEEANFIAGRIAFVNFEELEAKIREALQQLDEGKLVSLRSVLEEIERESPTNDGSHA
ncbi:MAG: hypothetical protein HYX68_21695 [Planctomycetes bacterium]|nr:hypothetical protein [Planctomycetota bacterium]